MQGLSDEGLGETPAARRRALHALSDAALAARLLELARGLRPHDATSLAAAAGLPLGEVIASPFALRMCAMGVAVGATSRPRELRALLDWTSVFEVRDPEHDVWEQGVLRTGKYQGFSAESPIAIHDPAHVSKWGPHELLHRAAGFFFRPGMTRFELYLGARLNELAPVTTFYGAEQAMRLDEGPFDRAAAGRRPRARIEDARWRTDEPAALAARALAAAPIFRDGLAHFERELAAIDEELATGRRVRTQHLFLDTSSDATAYVVGHFERLRQPAIERVLDGRGVERIEDYREAIEALLDRLLFGELDARPEPALARRQVALDLLLRAAHLGEGVEADLEPLLGLDDPDVLRAELPRAVGREGALLVLADGSPEGRAVAQLAEGLAHALPRTSALVPELAARLAADPALLERGPLAVRAYELLDASGSDPGIVELARLEAAIVGAERDDAIEWLATPEAELPDALEDGEVFAHRAVQRLETTHDVLRAHAEGGAPAPGPSTLLVVGFEDAVSVVPVPREIAAAVDAVRGAAGPAALEPSWLRELVGAGVLGWRPRGTWKT